MKSLINKYYDLYVKSADSNSDSTLNIGDFFRSFSEFIITQRRNDSKEFKHIKVAFHTLHYAHSIHTGERPLPLEEFAETHFRSLKNNFKAYVRSHMGVWLEPRRIEAYNSAIVSMPSVISKVYRDKKNFEKSENMLKEKINFFLSYKDVKPSNIPYSLN